MLFVGKLQKLLKLFDTQAADIRRTFRLLHKLRRTNHWS